MQPCAGRMAQALAGRQVSSQRAETGEFFPMSVWSSLTAMASICMMQATTTTTTKFKP